jgi:two-component system response regulator HydG
MPALRERPVDVPLLAEHFLKRLRQEHGKPSVKLDGKALEALAAHSWPGNVRELQNVVERLIVLNQSGLILEQDVRPCLAPKLTESASGPVALGASVAGAEKAAIEAALKTSGGNRTHAAKALGISRRTLHNKLNEYGIF